MASVSFRDSINTVVYTPDTEGLVYASINKAVRGVYISPTTAEFTGTWAVAPAFLPVTSVNDFTFFVNGQYIERTAIVSFTIVNETSTLVIDPVVLEFNFDQSDVILAVGKFN